MGPISPERLKSNWALEVGIEQSWEDLRSNHATLFPGRKVSSLVFGGVYKEIDVEANNRYILDGSRDSQNRSWPLQVTRPEWDAGKILEGMASGFVGIKPYPDLAQSDSMEVSIFDFLPKEHLRVVNDLGGILMLHLPRAGRLADTDNISELLEIAQEYPQIIIIAAHIGRSFCLPTAKKGLPHLKDCTSIVFDTSANLNADVFRYALDTVGPDRLLFGSDLPITMMRGVREHVGEEYINYTDAPYKWNTNRKSPEEEAQYTFFLYEELRALIEAVEDFGGAIETMEKIMYSNAAKLLGERE